MSGFDWNSIFELPKAALAGNRRIPKTVLVKQASLTKTEQKALDKMSRLEHFATVQKSTTRIPPFVDERRDVQSIVFLHCEMGDSHAYAEIGRLLHGCFPNPTVILFNGINHLCISVATTRKSLAEKGAVVVDAVESTGHLYTKDEGLKAFYNSLAFGRLPQGNLQAFLEGMAWNVKLSHAVWSVGFFPSCPAHKQAQLKELLDKQEDLNKKITATIRQRRLDKDLTLNESAKLRMQEKKLSSELDVVVDEMKEICNG